MTNGLQLPYRESAILELAKLKDYCLNLAHARGRHKARLFQAALGMGSEHAEELRVILLDAARRLPASLSHADVWGQQWRIDVHITRQDRSAVVRTIWIVRNGETLARFVTCWVL
jgi:hypothetical protein